MKFFKEMKVFKLKSMDADNVEKQVNSLPLRSCEGLAASFSIGFINPIDGEDKLLIRANQICLLCLGIEKKVLPEEVVNKETDFKIKKLQELREIKTISRREKIEIKDQTENELLKKAFTVIKKIYFYIDISNNYIVINSTSNSAVAAVVKLLPKLGIEYKDLICTKYEFLTGWFLNQSYPENIRFQAKCKLENDSQQNKLLIESNGDITYSEDIKSLANLCSIRELEVIWGEELAFTLTSSMGFKNISILDFFNNNSSENELTNLVLMSSLFAEMLNDIPNWDIESKLLDVENPSLFGEAV